MAISTPTVLDTVAQTTTATTITSATLSPDANALLLVIATGSSTTNATTLPITITDTFSPNLTWTPYTVNSGATTPVGVAIFVAQTGATPGTGTVTATFNTSTSRRVLNTTQIASGFNATPVAQSNTGVGTTSITVTLSGTPAADSMVFGAAGLRGASAGLTPGGAYSEVVETLSSTNHIQNVEYDLVSPTTTVDWAVSASAIVAAVALEIAAAAAGGADDFRVQTLDIGGQFGVAQYQTGGAGLVML